MTKHSKKHNFLSYSDILDIQSLIAAGKKISVIASHYNVSEQTIYSFHPRSKSYRPDLIRVRKAGKMFKKSGNTAPKSDNTTKPKAKAEKATKIKLSKDAEWYILAASEVFDKTPERIVDEMIKTCKILKANTVHG